ncbi:MAG TPA: hypothetical protein VK369_13215 [Segetibacter sp.]|nr:hypothetical protein [Segetibacter sp.]
MVNIKLERDVIIFVVAGWDKLWSFKSSLEIPIAHITDVYADPNPAMGWFEGLKIIGTSIPNIFKAGTFYQEGEVVFWDVRNPQNTIVIELVHEQFNKLVIEVAEPVAVVNTIIKAIYTRRV